MPLKITHLRNKLAALIALSFAVVITLSNAAGTITPGGNGGRTGASFDLGTCGDCHSGGTFMGVTATVQLLSGTTPVTTYVAGASYTVRIRVGSASISSLGYHYGFQAVCVQGSTNNDINNWGTIPSVAHIATWSARTYIEQSATLLSATSPTINIPWTAPASGTGNVVFYAGGCVVNNNTLATGDNSATGSLTVTESTTGCVPATLSATPTDVSCNGYGDGSINLTATGGTGAIGYSWTGPGGYSATTENISSLSGGVYTVVVTSTGGCSDTTTATVNEPAALTATVTSNAPVCPGGTLTFTTTPSGGTGGAGSYSYIWSGPNSFSSASADPSVTSFTAADSGVYTFSFMDVLSCSFTTTIDVGLAPVPVISLGPDTTICYFDSIMVGTVLSGDTYLWSTTATTPTIAIHGSAGAATYYVTVTNSAGCSSSDSINISVNPCEGGVKNVAANAAITLYPNPANDIITINNTGHHTLQRISVYNAMGVKVYEKQINSNTGVQEIDTRLWAMGLYFVSLESDGSITNQKVVIAR